MVKLPMLVALLALSSCNGENLRTPRNLGAPSPRPTSNRPTPTSKRPTSKRPTSKRPTTKKLTAAPTSTTLPNDLNPGDNFNELPPKDVSTAIIPEMEHIPEDIVDTPIQDVPITLPEGSMAENFVLERTASVCATSQNDAFNQCSNFPVCKYILDSAGKATSKIKPGQGKCIPRCDQPLGPSICGARQQCYPYVLPCIASSWN